MDKIGIIKAKWETLKKSLEIIRKIGGLGKSVDPDIARDIIAHTGSQLNEISEGLEQRKMIAQNVGSFSHKKYGKNVATLTDNTNLLDGILQILTYMDPDLIQTAIDSICEIDENEQFFYDDKVSALLHYFNNKKYCIYQDVIGFIDENLDVVLKEEWCVQAINSVMEGYEEENLGLPFEDKTIEEIISNLDFVNEADFYQKNRESFINLINGIFQSYYDEMPQIVLTEGRVKGISVTPFKENKNV